MEEKTYLCIDLKTFYASVECVERGLDPFTTKLVVADPDRESTTICLAISPRMKELGVHNRCRLFEIPKDISYIMAKPRMKKYIDEWNESFFNKKGMSASIPITMEYISFIYKENTGVVDNWTN